jgi:hypothetical protein
MVMMISELQAHFTSPWRGPWRGEVGAIGRALARLNATGGGDLRFGTFTPPRSAEGRSTLPLQGRVKNAPGRWIR